MTDQADIASADSKGGGRAKSGRPARSPLWRVAIPCFVAQNLAFGVSQGSFGPLLQSNAAHFAVSQSTIMLCVSMLNLSLGLMAPIVSNVMDRLPIRLVMVGGSLACALGYFGLYASSAFPMAMAMYGLLGVGCAILGVLAPLALVNRWLADRRGRVLGWVNAPIVLLLVPLFIGEFMAPLGRGGLLLCACLLSLATIPLFLSVPSDPDRDRTADAAGRDDVARKGETRLLFRSGGFWTIAVAIGVLAGMSSAFIVNVVAIGSVRGMGFAAAASLVSVFAASGAVGSIILGWLCDRIGALPTVALAAACQAGLCLALLFANAALTFPLVAMMGVFSAPILTLMGAAISQTIPPGLVNRAIGAVYFVKLPFIFTFAPAFEYFSHWGLRFGLSFRIMAVALACTAVACLLLHASRSRRAAAGQGYPPRSS